MTTRTCDVDGCNGRVLDVWNEEGRPVVNNYCAEHYQNWLNTGRPEGRPAVDGKSAHVKVDVSGPSSMRVEVRVDGAAVDRFLRAITKAVGELELLKS